MTKNNKRFANRETVVKGFIINTNSQEFTPFEETISYARSTQKAVELVREKMQLDNNPSIVITVNEIVNEAPKPIKYNDSKVYDLAYCTFDTEAEAQEKAEVDNNIMRVVTWYQISGQIWAIDNDGKYITEWYTDESPMNLTKCDQRDFIKMSYEMYQGNTVKVIGIHATEKKPINLYCVITAEELEKCIES